MKRVLSHQLRLIVILFWALLIIVPERSYAQTPILTTKASTKSGGYEGHRRITIDIYDNTYITVSYYDELNLGNKTFKGSLNDINNGVLKYNKCGELEWYINFSADSVQVNDIDVDSKGNVYALMESADSEIKITDGFNINNTIGGMRSYLVKFNEAGVYQWSKGVNGFPKQRLNIRRQIPNDIVVDDEDMVYIFSEFRDSVEMEGNRLDVEYPSIAMIKLDENGDVLMMQKMFDSDYRSINLNFTIEKLVFDENTKSIWMLLKSASYLTLPNFGKLRSTCFLFEIGKDLIVKKAHILNPENRSGHFESFYRLKNGDFILGGEYWDDDNVLGNTLTYFGNWDQFIMRVDADLNTIWFKNYGGKTGYEAFIDVTMDNDEEFVYAWIEIWDEFLIEGNYYDHDSRGSILASFDVDGNFRWVEIAEPGVLSEAADLLVDNDDNIIIGEYRGNGNYEFGCYSQPIQDLEIGFLKIADGDTNLFCDEVRCSDGIVQLKPNIQGDSYLWSNNATNESIYVSSPGTYTLTMQMGTCTYTDTVEYIVDDIPIPVDIGPDTIFCEDFTYTLTANTLANSFLWNTNAASRSITINQAGEYSIEVSADGCVGYDTVNIGLKTEPVPVTINSDSTFCGDDGLTITINTPATKYLWNTSDTTSSINVNTPGQYTVTVDENGCKGHDTVNVTSTPYPQSTLQDSTGACFEGVLITLNAGTADSYLWSTGETTPTISIDSHGVYSVEMRNGDCITTDEIEVYNLCKSTIFIPSAFRPNSDLPENRVFKVVGTRLEYVQLTIYNRWGEMIYTGENEKAQWDGTYKGEPVMQGQYMYMVIYQPQGDKKTRVNGYFTLLR